MISAVSRSIEAALRSTAMRMASVAGRRLPQNAIPSGIRKIASTFEIAVIDTDSATLPPARWVSTLEMLPGGQQATRIIPNAIEPRTSRTMVSASVTAGSTMNCAAIPMTIARRHSHDTREICELGVQGNAEHDRREDEVEQDQRRRIEVQPNGVEVSGRGRHPSVRAHIPDGI